jgi:hypothetical protein
MPILRIPPPDGAVRAFSEGLSWLAEADDRLRDLHEAKEFKLGPIPPPHVVEVWSLDGAILEAEASRRTWRFFVSGQHIPLGVVEVAPAERTPGADEYEFLAFREGRPVTATALTFARANEFAARRAEMALAFLKLPGLGAIFLWLQNAEIPLHRVNWGFQDWLFAIPPAVRGFPADEPEPMPRAVERLRSEATRVQNAAFVRSLTEHREPPPPSLEL